MQQTQQVYPRMWGGFGDSQAGEGTAKGLEAYLG